MAKTKNQNFYKKWKECEKARQYCFDQNQRLGKENMIMGSACIILVILLILAIGHGWVF